MDDKKTQKNANEIICKKCNFKCFKNSEYKRHLITAKHKRMTMDDKKTPKNARIDYICECGKSYKYRQGLHKHRKQCSALNNTTINLETRENLSLLEVISQNKELMNLLAIQNQEHKEETKELMEQNKKIQETIKAIVPKIGNNNNNNNTINNHFNIQNFLYEDCKDAINFSEFIDNIKISFEDLEQQSQIGFIKGISKLFIKNLHELGTHKRPIHCTDKKRKTLYIKEDNEWDKEGSQDRLKKGINILSIKSQEKLIQEKQENQEEYENIDSEFSQKCISIQRNLYPDNPRETTINKVIENITQNSTFME